ncbi:MAG: cyclic pyranopterin monophosphate synthase [Abditibacteriota bacterium]|nr:cyclic pyranopterin monophosphate synthase [Abditibacteriota bacterium]
MNESTPEAAISDCTTQMIDVGGKEVTNREAVATGTIAMLPETLEMVRQSTLPKGNAMETARVAAIMAAKRTPDFIPLCHPLLISHANCEFEFENTTQSTLIRVTTRVRCEGKTGVEMEALTACTAALLTIYDMTKGVDESLEIREVHLLAKRGGKSGDWMRALNGTQPKPSSP